MPYSVCDPITFIEYHFQTSGVWVIVVQPLSYSNIDCIMEANIWGLIPSTFAAIILTGIVDFFYFLMHHPHYLI